MRFALVATLLLLQDSATDTLKKMEEAIGAAKSYSVKAIVEVTGKKDNLVTQQNYTVVLKSKGDGMAYFNLQGSVEGKPISPLTVVSDGRKVRYESGGQTGSSDHKIPLGVISRKLYHRAGLFAAAKALLQASVRPDRADLEKMYAPSQVTAAPDEKIGDRNCKVYAMDLVAPVAGDPPIKSRVWIDAEKNLLMRRETILAAGKETGTVVENYTEHAVDGDIPDDVFQIK